MNNKFLVFLGIGCSIFLCCCIAMIGVGALGYNSLMNNEEWQQSLEESGFDVDELNVSQDQQATNLEFDNSYDLFPEGLAGIPYQVGYTLEGTVIEESGTEIDITDRYQVLYPATMFRSDENIDESVNEELSASITVIEIAPSDYDTYQGLVAQTYEIEAAAISELVFPAAGLDYDSQYIDDGGQNVSTAAQIAVVSVYMPSEHTLLEFNFTGPWEKQLIEETLAEYFQQLENGSLSSLTAADFLSYEESIDQINSNRQTTEQVQEYLSQMEE